MKRLLLVIIGLMLVLPLVSVSASKIVVNGLSKNTAIVNVDGKMHVLKVGKASNSGIKLLKADTRQAVVEIDGVVSTLYLTRQVGGSPYKAPERKMVRIARGRGGHFLTAGRINNRSVTFMVDTGATSIAMNTPTAKSLGLDITEGRTMNVNTASGTAKARRVMLRSVAVGSLEIANVEAVIVEGDYPIDILLGNTYLSKVDMKVENGILVLQDRF
ncbi:MAG: TIGR02281 family clan AA aspartic protease [Alteromonadaceae bacterium]|nr:MAG: TIGR02281 family clan AA aspartic protease [Alteromonadaceae bacterium]